MPPTVIDAQIRARIQEFAEELSSLVKQAAVETVQDALGGSAAPAKRRGPGRPRKATSARRKPGPRSGRPRKTKTTAKAGKRIRRTTDDLEALAGKVLAFVRSNAGARMEQISAGIGVQTKDLGRPVASLLEAKKLRTEGHRRGTRYLAGGGKGPVRKKAGRAKKAGRKKDAKRKAAKKAKRGGRKKATKRRLPP